jgi:hypothetical protein
MPLLYYQSVYRVPYAALTLVLIARDADMEGGIGLVSIVYSGATPLLQSITLHYYNLNIIVA